MADDFESAAVRAMRGHRLDVLNREAEQMQRMAAEYLRVEETLADKIDALSGDIAQLTAAGKVPSRGQLYQLDRFQSLHEQTLVELESFNNYAVSEISREQAVLAQMGAEHAASAINTIRPQTLLESFNRLPSATVMNMIGLTGEGSPLYALLSQSGAAIRDAVASQLITSIALGRNPNVTGREIRKATGMGLDRAITIARTEQMRVYRESSLDIYRRAGIKKFKRMSAHDARTCIACLVQDGKEYDTSAGFSDHVCGRCTLVPIVPGAKKQEQEDGKKWFEKQTAEVQQAVMGKARWDVWKSGDVGWDEMAQFHTDAAFGGAWVPTPLKTMLPTHAAGGLFAPFEKFGALAGVGAAIVASPIDDIAIGLGLIYSKKLWTMSYHGVQRLVRLVAANRAAHQQISLLKQEIESIIRSRIEREVLEQAKKVRGRK